MPILKTGRKKRRREQAHSLAILRIAQDEALEVFYQAHDHAVSLQAAIEVITKALAEREKDSD